MHYGNKLVAFLLGVLVSVASLAAVQDKYPLPAPYAVWEKAYLQAYPELQPVMTAMIQTTARQLKAPEQDILHNRVCAALVYRMALEQKLPPEERKLAIAGDLLHNLSKEESSAVLSDPAQWTAAEAMVERLKAAGYLKPSPRFWAEARILQQPKIADNRALIHHITGAVMAGKMLAALGGFSLQEIEKIQVAVLQHSTGYWYFRASVNQLAGDPAAWEVVYPEPENDFAKFIHDADVISQFVPESVAPAGSKWRELAKKRWGAKTAQEEGQIVFYVFQKLFEEAKTASGRQLAKEKWDQIAPELVKLMGLKPGDDPLKVLGVPKVFQ